MILMPVYNLAIIEQEGRKGKARYRHATPTAWPKAAPDILQACSPLMEGEGLDEGSLDSCLERSE